MNIVIPALMILALALTGCAAPGAADHQATYRRITMQEAAAIMEAEEGYILLDVRTPEEYASGHIPGAVLIPNETIGTNAPAQLPDKNQLIMVYCRSGNRSRQAAGKLAVLGYTNIVEIGGVGSWPGELVTE